MERSNLTSCSNCEHKVSKQAEKCPNCGKSDFYIPKEICFFCKNNDAKSNLIKHTGVDRFSRSATFARKSVSKFKDDIYFHEACRNKYLGPNKKSIRSKCSDCGKRLKLKVEGYFNFTNRGPCPNCGSPNQPQIFEYRTKYRSGQNTRLRKKKCSICGNNLYAGFQSISEHTDIWDRLFVYHSICKSKEEIGFYDLGRGRNIIVLICIIFIFIIISFIF